MIYSVYKPHKYALSNTLTHTCDVNISSRYHQAVDRTGSWKPLLIVEQIESLVSRSSHLSSLKTQVFEVIWLRYNSCVGAEFGFEPVSIPLVVFQFWLPTDHQRSSEKNNISAVLYILSWGEVGPWLQYFFTFPWWFWYGTVCPRK